MSEHTGRVCIGLEASFSGREHTVGFSGEGKKIAIIGGDDINRRLMSNTLKNRFHFAEENIFFVASDAEIKTLDSDTLLVTMIHDEIVLPNLTDVLLTPKRVNDFVLTIDPKEKRYQSYFKGNPYHKDWRR